MQKLFKSLVLKYLIALARYRMKRLGLFTIGVTGSVGKTSTKEAVAHVLGTKFKVLHAHGGYNSEFGLPLTILEQRTGFSSPWLWVKTLTGATLRALFGPQGMQLLVIEMGIDEPGGMTELLKIVTPHVGVFTNVRPVHLAKGQFKDMEDIFREKVKMIYALPDKGTAILNSDDPYVVSLKDKLKCRTIFYGQNDAADLQAVKVMNYKRGIRFAIKYGDEIVDGEIQLLGEFQIYVVLAAVAVALTQGFTLKEAVDAVSDYRLPPGRMNLIEGINDTIIIDSSYNASPEAVKAALVVLHNMKLADAAENEQSRTIAVLGNMNELGDVSHEKHREIGVEVAKHADVLITIGDEAKLIAEEALRGGMRKSEVFSFANAEEAGEFLLQKLQAKDILLVKGSQNNVRLERLVKMLMKDPSKAKDLLARQEWKK